MICNNCGSEVGSDSKFCGKCGTLIVRDNIADSNNFYAENQSNKKVPKSSIFKKIINIAEIAFGVLLLFAIFMGFYTKVIDDTKTAVFNYTEYDIFEMNTIGIGKKTDVFNKTLPKRNQIGSVLDKAMNYKAKWSYKKVDKNEYVVTVKGYMPLVEKDVTLQFGVVYLDDESLEDINSGLLELFMGISKDSVMVNLLSVSGDGRTYTDYDTLSDLIGELYEYYS